MTFSPTQLLGKFMDSLFGDHERAHNPRPPLVLDMLSDYLPYRVYDPETRLYFNAGSKGFILAAAPMVGADERTGELLGQFFSEGLPAGACLQVLHYASPRISRNIAPWFAPRYEQGGVYQAIARHRSRSLYNLVWNSGSAHAPFHARHHHADAHQKSCQKDDVERAETAHAPTPWVNAHIQNRAPELGAAPPPPRHRSTGPVRSVSDTHSGTSKSRITCSLRRRPVRRIPSFLLQRANVRWKNASEIMIVGTGAEVTPVREIAGTAYTPGRITETLLNDYEKLVRMSPADVARRLA